MQAWAVLSSASFTFKGSSPVTDLPVDDTVPHFHEDTLPNCVQLAVWADESYTQLTRSDKCKTMAEMLAVLYSPIKTTKSRLIKLTTATTTSFGVCLTQLIHDTHIHFVVYYLKCKIQGSRGDLHTLT
jgi:hypothetical protein